MATAIGVAVALVGHRVITSKHVDDMVSRRHGEEQRSAIKRILGMTPRMDKALGVAEKRVYDIVKQVGIYGERYDRNLGNSSPLKIARSLNAQWTKGGILYAPPIR